jgi:hypothetical protein
MACVLIHLYIFFQEAMRLRAPDLYELHVGDSSVIEMQRRLSPLQQHDSLGRLERQVRSFSIATAWTILDSPDVGEVLGNNQSLSIAAAPMSWLHEWIQVILQEQRHAELRKEQEKRRLREAQTVEGEKEVSDWHMERSPDISDGEDSRNPEREVLGLEASSIVATDEDYELFKSVMKTRFLAGKDIEFVDYSAIDANSSLDDHWAAIENHDAQERYFDAE